jgi:hypothetical protein
MVMTRQVPKFLFAALAFAALTGSAHAAWQDQVTPHDLDRLGHLSEARDYAVREAQSRSGTGDFRAIKETFEPAAHAVPENALLGSWRCRQMKLGGMSGYYVFSWFNCRISKANGGIWLEKDGTQRMAGFLYPQDGMWVYLGAQSAKGEPIHRYSGHVASIGAEVNPDDQVGALVGIGHNRLRLDMPAPTQESDFDSIEFVR